MRTDSKERPFEVDVNENGYVEVWAEGEWVMDFDWTGDPEDHSAIQESGTPQDVPRSWHRLCPCHVSFIAKRICHGPVTFA